MAVPGNFTLQNLIVKSHQEDNLAKVDGLMPKQPQSLIVTNDDRCHNLTHCKKKEPASVNFEICNGLSAQQRNEENVLLKNVMVNRGMTHVMYDIQYCYLIGIVFGWLLLGVFQYFMCVVILGECLLYPWYFTCAWIIELVYMLNIIMIIWIIKFSHEGVEFLEYCEKITWTGFTFLIIQGLIIILLLLPISNLFELVFGDFSRPINFFFYWTMIAFPHITILYLATFDGYFKIFRSFSQYLRHSNSWNKHKQNIRSVDFGTTNQQKASADKLNNDNNIELRELNYHPINRNNKKIHFSS